jgi:hypothetical protein
MELIINGLVPLTQVFMVSNGQETKYHFTTKQFSLPSNVINDIDINSTGEVFIATKRLVSFKGCNSGK